MNNKRRIIGSLFVILVICAFIAYLTTHLSDFKLLLTINPIYILFLAIVNLLMIIVNGLFMKWSIALFDKKISFHESVRISLISSAGNFFAPAGSGLGFRALYLKKKYKLSYSNYLSVLLCNYVMVFFITSLLGLLSLFMLKDRLSISAFALAIFFVVLFIFSVLSMVIRIGDNKYKISRYEWANRFLEIAKKISKGWVLILADKTTVILLLMLILVNTLLMITDTYLIMASVGIGISFGGLLIFSVLGSLSVFINITPGNLGVKEAVYLVFSTIIGLTVAQIISVSLIDRTVQFGVLLLLWTIYGKRFYTSMVRKMQ